LLTGSVVSGEFALPAQIWEKDWFWVAVFLGFLFVLTFNLMALTVRHFGVGIATIFQKMSLVAPAILAMVWYNETSSVTRIAGIVMALGSVFLLNQKNSGHADHGYSRWELLLPMTIFVGSCLVDTSLFLVEKEKLAPNGDIQFVSSLFFFAGVFGLMKLVYLFAKGKIRYEHKNVLGGIALGIPNFFSIYLLLLLLANGWEGSLVFPVNNVGVLLLAAVFGYVLFGEKWTRIRLTGFFLAIAAIVLIAM
jgi:drug/metabolite transporter (DMT)-like permease